MQKRSECHFLDGNLILLKCNYSVGWSAGQSIGWTRRDRLRVLCETAVEEYCMNRLVYTALYISFIKIF